MEQYFSYGGEDNSLDKSCTLLKTKEVNEGCVHLWHPINKKITESIKRRQIQQHFKDNYSSKDIKKICEHRKKYIGDINLYVDKKYTDNVNCIPPYP